MSNQGTVSKSLSEAEEELFAEWAEEEERLKTTTPPPEKASSAQLASDKLDQEEKERKVDDDEEGSSSSSSDLESKTTNHSKNHARSKKKRKVEHLNVDTATAMDTSSADAQASLDLPITPTYPGVNLPSVEPEIKEEYVKKDEYDKLINSHTETIKKLKNDYKLMADRYKKEIERLKSELTTLKQKKP
ncbi:hypothetical protein C9374_007593 [Naegleria lovaniensis]|uniref:Uncharacterized protein n=1 Tax=Naegleria lovaniensis TaxID=51637 RepID=A0AA88KGW4_NAELO|nr:uncharacterized protein C9374_007593 [Naegleria lovaniensis]KAG2378955.1 hypothetical protein C9374_007593 [Naegleria lovaniensis]